MLIIAAVMCAGALLAIAFTIDRDAEIGDRVASSFLTLLGAVILIAGIVMLAVSGR